MQINRNRLLVELARIRNARFLSVTTATTTRLNKTNGDRTKEGKKLNPFYNKVLSVRTSVYQPCYDYKAAVERARAKSDDYTGDVEFETGETWYNRVSDADNRSTAFAEHKKTGQLYFVGRELVKGKTTYIASEDIVTDGTTFSAGDQISVEELEPYFPAYKPSAKQGLSEDEEIKPRTLKIESIRGFRRDGERIVIEMPILRNEQPTVTRQLARMLANLPDVDINSIPEQFRLPTVAE